MFKHVDMNVVRMNFDSGYCEESLTPKFTLFYDNYDVKYVAANPESSCLSKQMAK